VEMEKGKEKLSVKMMHGFESSLQKKEDEAE